LIKGAGHISAELKRPKWGGIKVSPDGVHKFYVPTASTLGSSASET
jgi:hypothetical protein